MDEALPKGQKQSKLLAVVSWPWHHRVMSAQLVILMVCALFLLIRPVNYQIFYFNAVDCGTLSRFGERIAYGNLIESPDIRCFVQAHQQCAAATLPMNEQGVDMGAVLTLRTADGLGGCALSELAYPTGCPTVFCGAFIKGHVNPRASALGI